jgi:excisionase family DNA binding protein
MNRDSLESFVDADQAAKFLFLTRRHVLKLARAGRLPGHPIGGGARRVWRFRLSELASAVRARDNSELACDEKAVSFSTKESQSCGELKRLRGTLSTGTVPQDLRKCEKCSAE